MSYARQMLETYPRDLNVDPGVLAATIDALNDCTQACAADADADLSEPNVAELVKCIRLCLECTDVCGATVGVVSRPAEWDANVVKPLLEACVASCKSCGDECEHHARMHAHCRHPELRESALWQCQTPRRNPPRPQRRNLPSR